MSTNNNEEVLETNAAVAEQEPEREQSSPLAAKPDYLNQATYGRSGIGSWLIGVFSILALYIVGTIVLYIFLLIIDSDPSITGAIGSLDDATSFFGYFFLLASFLPLLGAIWFIQTAWHRRTWYHLFTSAPSIRWKLSAFSALIYGAFLVALALVSLIIDEWTWVYNGETYWGFLLITLLLVPFQAASEEFFFRGYLTQFFSRYFNNRWIVYIVTAALFTSIHAANPETQDANPWLYLGLIFSFGILASILTHYTGGLEAAIGVHVINNIFVFSIMSNDLADTPQTYLISFGELDITYATVVSEVIFLVVAGLAILHFTRRMWQQKRKPISTASVSD